MAFATGRLSKIRTTQIITVVLQQAARGADHLKSRHNRPTGNNPDLNKLRIIGGLWRGRKLSFPGIDGLRPTGDRIRETLFNWLAPYIVGANTIDLFAGSGALGIEAASRLAGQVTLVEYNSRAALALQHNIDSLHARNISLVKSDALAFLDRTDREKPYDIVFLDPPFKSDLLTPAISRLSQPGLLGKGAFIYVETDKNIAVETPVNWTIFREKVAGNVCYRLYLAN